MSGYEKAKTHQLKSIGLFRRLAVLPWLATLGLIILTALPRLTALNQYIIVDEADRWHWAENFVYALSRADWAGTRVGDGYPGIVPVWAESIWIFLEAARRSLLAGGWIGEPGLYLIFHEWDRPAFLYQQRLPIVLLNTVLALAVIWAVWRLFGGRVALVGGILIALDPFYLSDSRVNRAEALITGLITLSILALVFYDRRPRWRYVFISGILGGLSFLTKIQALAILPAVLVIGLFIYSRKQTTPEVNNTPNKPPSPPGAPRSAVPTPYSLLPTSYSLLPAGRSALGSPYSLLLFLLAWVSAASLTWFLLWPAMWVTPQETLALVYDYATHKVGAEGVNLFFMGQTYADADPGPVFYPFAFLMRVTPLALLGLIAWGIRVGWPAARLKSSEWANEKPVSFAFRAGVILIIYVLLYSLAMTWGSHKQDRYLLPIFLSVDILAALGLVYLWDSLKKRVGKNLPPPRRALRARQSLLLTPYSLLVIQLLTVLPHHPYYYSYFNPLLGDGATAVRTMRIGWGEGMDQVGAYLAAKPDSRNLIVASRFTHNMVDFKGDQISLLPDGRWTQADYIVLYIQQTQRRQEPSPEFIDYFLARPAEKVVTIGGIDYAWIYPIPFTVPANPEISLIPKQVALVGYRWEETGAIRLFWQNLGLPTGHHLAVRLRSPTAQTDWAVCSPDPAFAAQAKTPGAYAESLCALAPPALPAGTYTVEFSLTSPPTQGAQREPEPFVFPEGWQAATITAGGEVGDTPSQQRLEVIAGEAIPLQASPLDRIYEGQIRLAAYQLDPPMPQPGQTVHLTLYWQRLKEVLEPVRLTIQLADSRSLPLGRFDAGLAAQQWLLGQVITTSHKLDLSSDLTAPLAAQIEVTLRNQAEVSLRPTNSLAESLGAAAIRFTVAPKQWPALEQTKAVDAVWQNQIALRGYTLSPETVQPGAAVAVNLFWQAGQPVTENYRVFVHLLDEAGQIKAQNDDLPRAGAYPTPWWQPGQPIEDTHTLVLPPDLPRGVYQLIVGLYRPGDGLRLSLAEQGDSFKLGPVELR